MMKYAAVFLLLQFPAWGAITNGRIVRTSSTQIVIGYTAPSVSACTVEVSEQPGYSPLVPDVDPGLFSGSNNDLGRFQKLQAGQSRQFVIGTRNYQRADNGRVYSRALAAATLHHIRVACGGDTFEITASTGTLPFGISYVDPPQPSDLHNGFLMLPSVYDSAREDSYIDPSTGVKIYRMTRAGDLDVSESYSDVGFLSVDESTDWVNPNNILAADSSNATYSGASCSGTCDWIKLRAQSLWPAEYGISMDYVRLNLVGSGSDANAANRTIEWGLGLKISGSCSAVPLDGTTRTLVLPQTTPSQVDAVVVRGDTLRPPTAAYQILNFEVSSGFCVLIRKTTSTGTISIDHAKWDSGGSSPQSTGSGGNYTWSSDVPDSDGYITTISQTGGARAVLYKVKMNPSVNIKYLGMVPNFDGRQCLTLAFSPTVANRYFCQPASSGVLFQLDYVGDSTNKTAPHYAEVAGTVLSSDLQAAMQAFTVAHSEHYPVLFDSTKFNCGFNAIVQDDLLQIKCFRSQQDSIAWLGVWKLGVGIVAAYAEWMHPTSRWCTFHSYEEIGQYGGLYFWTTQLFKGGGIGLGPYTATLNGAINSSQTTLTLSGQPMSPVADTFLMNIAAGDTILVSGTEYMTITSVANFPTISVTRGVGYTPFPHANGDSVSMQCAGQPGGSAYQIGTPQVLWDPIADPYGDAGGISNTTYHGHETYRPGKGVNNNSYSLDNLRIGVDLALPYAVSQHPEFADWTPPAAGTSYQTHPTWHTTIGTEFANRVFADIRPFIGGNLFSAFGISGCDPTKLLPTPGGCAMQRVPGTTNTYKYTFSGSDRPRPTLGYRKMPVFGVAGYSNLKNISGPGSTISDATPYTFCIALLANECRTGSVSGDMFMSAVGVNYYGCNGGEGFSGGVDGCITERAAGTISLTEHNTTPPGVNNFSSRDLTLVNSLANTSRFSSGASIKHLPNGEGVTFTYFGPERYDIFIAKVPPYEGAVDSVNRQNFGDSPVTVTNVPGGATRLLVKFGYDQNFNCSPNRADACYAVASTINESTPFLWESELTSNSGLDVSGGCSSGCTVTIPAVPNRIGFYQLIYRNSGGATIAASPVETF